MASWFNQNAAFDAQDPGYDNTAEQRKIELAKKVAASLHGGLEDGKMVSGWYVGPGKGQMYGNILKNLMGTYGDYKNNQAQDANDKAGREAYSTGRDLLFKEQNDPQSYVNDAQQNASAYTYKHPEQVGPQMEQVTPPPAPDTGAQSFPVKPQPDFQITPLTPASAQGNPGRGMVSEQPGERAAYMASQAASQAAPQGAPSLLGARLAQAQSELVAAKASGNRDAFIQKQGQVDTLQRQLASAGGPALQAQRVQAPAPSAGMPAPLQAPAQAPVAPPMAPVAPPAILPPPNMAAQAPAVEAPVAAPAAPEPTFNIDGQAQQRYLSRAVQADRMKAMNLLDRSGERGQGLTRAIEAQMLGPKTPQYTTAKPGEVILRDGHPIYQVAGDSVEQEKLKMEKEKIKREDDVRASTINSSKVALNGTLTAIDEAIGSGAPSNATGLTGKLGSAAAAMGFPNRGSEARAKLDGLVSQAIQAGIAHLQTQGASATQLANTEKEAKRLASSYANVDYDRQSAEEVTRQLGLFRNKLSDMFNGQIIPAGTARSQADGASRQMGAVGSSQPGGLVGPSGVNWGR